jgi:Tn3 transposase DDE domain
VIRAPVPLRQAAVRQPLARARHGRPAALLRTPPPRDPALLVDLGPVQPVREQGRRGHRPRRDPHARRDPRQPDRAADREPHHRHARLHPDHLRRLRPRRPAVRSRIRDIDHQRLYQHGTPPTVEAAELVKHKLRSEPMTPHWHELLRLAASLDHGWAPASLLLARPQAGSRRNPLAPRPAGVRAADQD